MVRIAVAQPLLQEEDANVKSPPVLDVDCRSSHNRPDVLSSRRAAGREPQKTLIRHTHPIKHILSLSYRGTNDQSALPDDKQQSHFFPGAFQSAPNVYNNLGHSIKPLVGFAAGSIGATINNAKTSE